MHEIALILRNSTLKLYHACMHGINPFWQASLYIEISQSKDFNFYYFIIELSMPGFS